MPRQTFRPRRRQFLAVAVAIVLTATLLRARDLTVDDDGPAAYRRIQDAIDAAVPGDVVLVAPGTYRENLRVKSGVAVVGAGASASIVDGGGLGPVATLVDCGAATRLEGFRLTGGQAGVGAGVRIERGAPVVRFNTIAGNRALSGGAYLYSYGGGVAVRDSAAVVSDNVIEANEADYGGGLHLEGGAARITRNFITGNTAGAGGGLDAYVVLGTDAWISGNTLVSNTALFGGGVELGGAGAPAVTSNLIVGNIASGSGASTAFGGGIDAYYSGARVAGNTIARNSARTGGGAAVLSGSTRFGVNIFAGNDASSAGGAIDVDAAVVAISGNLFHLNGRGTCSGPGASFCSDPSNLEADPRFVSEPEDYRLREGSPAIDSAPAGEAPAEDFRGQRRPLDGDRDGAAASDRGAFEHDRDAVTGVAFTAAAPTAGEPATAGDGAGGPALAWAAVTGAERYHVYSATFSGRFAWLPDTCRDADDADPSDRLFAEPLDPLPGQAIAYLVTAVISDVERSPGFDSRGLERILAAPCP